MNLNKITNRLLCVTLIGGSLTFTASANPDANPEPLKKSFLQKKRDAERRKGERTKPRWAKKKTVNKVAQRAAARVQPQRSNSIEIREAIKPTPKPKPAPASKPKAKEKRPNRFLAWLKRPLDAPKEKAELKREAAASKPKAPNAVQSAPIINNLVLARAQEKGSRVIVDISAQRAYMYVGDQIAVDTPISTARKGKNTPRGSFGVSQRVAQGKISTIYKVEMPYWMRLGGSAYGMHAGFLPGYPASAGCIRMPNEAARAIFNHSRSGMRVRIRN